MTEFGLVQYKILSTFRIGLLFLGLIIFVFGSDSLAASSFVNTPSSLVLGQTSKEAPSPEEGKEGTARKRKRFRRSKLTYDESEGLADRRKMLLTTGEDKAVDLDFDANMTPNGISYGNPQVVTTTLVKIGEKKQLVFKPLKAGETTVTVRDNEGNIKLIFDVRVTGTNLLRIAGEIRDLLRDIDGLEVRIVGPKVVIEGEVLIPTDFGRILTVIQDKAYADFVLNLTGLSPLAMQFLSDRIRNDINAFAPSVTTRVVNGMIFLEGTVNSEGEARRAASVANLYLPELRPGSLLERDQTVQRMPPRPLIQNFILVNPPPPPGRDPKLVRVTVHFVELTKDYNKVFGFKWQPGFTADPQIAIGQSAVGGAATGASASFSGTISSLIPKLMSSQAAGYARVLKTGTIVVRSGQPAKLNEQTEFPFAQAGPNGQLTSSSKAVGLSLAVTPLIVGASEDIQLDLDLDQTSLVGRSPVSGSAPVTATHKVSTKIFIKSNESAAVAAINSTDLGTDFNKDDPSSGSFEQQTSPLFNLMHSKAYRKKKTQFVIFVTPQIVSDVSEGTEDLKKNFRVKVK